MISVKETSLNSEVLKEFNYPFGNVFVFRDFVISEINRGVSLNWDDYAKLIVDDVSCFLGTNGVDLIYISHRINSYSVVPYDWMHYFNNSYQLKGFFIVSENKTRLLNSFIESLFFNNKIKRFKDLNTAVNTIKTGLLEIA